MTKAYQIFVGKSEGTGHLSDIGVSGRIALERIHLLQD
jgi:hypothetical protein